MKARAWGIGLLIAAGGLLFALAQDVRQPTVTTAFRVGLGEHLIDASGLSLYAFVADADVDTDTDGRSTCEGPCAEAWPPLTVEHEPVAGGGVVPVILNTIERADGSAQVTYNGWPLYRYQGDTERGDTEGQGLNDAWFLVSRDGTLIGAEGIASPAASAVGEDGAADDGGASSVEPRSVTAQIMSLGEEVYGRVASPACATCHGPQGGGGVGAELAGNDRLANAERVIKAIRDGGHIMPAFGSQLSDEQIAAVATFVRNSWGNDFGPVASEEVSGVR